MRSIHRYPTKKNYGQGNNKRNQRREAKRERKKIHESYKNGDWAWKSNS